MFIWGYHEGWGHFFLRHSRTSPFEFSTGIHCHCSRFTTSYGEPSNLLECLRSAHIFLAWRLSTSLRSVHRLSFNECSVSSQPLSSSLPWLGSEPIGLLIFLFSISDCVGWRSPRKESTTRVDPSWRLLNDSDHLMWECQLYLIAADVRLEKFLKVRFLWRFMTRGFLLSFCGLSIFLVSRVRRMAGLTSTASNYSTDTSTIAFYSYLCSCESQPRVFRKSSLIIEDFRIAQL